jgi:hypothetical protein
MSKTLDELLLFHGFVEREYTFAISGGIDRDKEPVCLFALALCSHFNGFVPTISTRPGTHARNQRSLM